MFPSPRGTNHIGGYSIRLSGHWTFRTEPSKFIVPHLQQLLLSGVFPSILHPSHSPATSRAKASFFLSLLLFLLHSSWQHWALWMTAVLSLMLSICTHQLWQIFADLITLCWVYYCLLNIVLSPNFNFLLFLLLFFLAVLYITPTLILAGILAQCRKSTLPHNVCGWHSSLLVPLPLLVTVRLTGKAAKWKEITLNFCLEFNQSTDRIIWEHLINTQWLWDSDSYSYHWTSLKADMFFTHIRRGKDMPHKHF